MKTHFTLNVRFHYEFNEGLLLLAWKLIVFGFSIFGFISAYSSLRKPLHRFYLQYEPSNNILPYFFYPTWFS